MHSTKFLVALMVCSLTFIIFAEFHTVKASPYDNKGDKHEAREARLSGAEKFRRAVPKAAAVHHWNCSKQYCQKQCLESIDEEFPNREEMEIDNKDGNCVGESCVCKYMKGGRMLSVPLFEQKKRALTPYSPTNNPQAAAVHHWKCSKQYCQKQCLQSIDQQFPNREEMEIDNKDGNCVGESCVCKYMKGGRMLSVPLFEQKKKALTPYSRTNSPQCRC